MRVSESHFHVDGTRDSDWSKACLDPPEIQLAGFWQATFVATFAPQPHSCTHTRTLNPQNLSIKMFAVAAQTTVRATAQVKATKVAAKEQKSA